jgi:hypothetical protein
MGLRHYAGFFWFLILVSIPALPAHSSDKEPLPVYIIERDTLQTRNFTPIINHQAMVINLGEKPVLLSLTSSFPTEKNKKGAGYPAFLDDSLIADPLFSPLEITPKKTSYLVQPEITVAKKEVTYLWNNVMLPPGESVVAQYDNYYGEQNYYWREDGFDFHGISVKTDYSVQQQKNGQIDLTLNFDILNNTPDTVQDFDFGVFVPVRQLLKDGDINILKLVKICTSANSESSQITKADGFGEAAEGVAASFRSKELQHGKQESFFLSISGIPAPSAKVARSWPIVTVVGRSIRPAIWPATAVTSAMPINEGRFSYLSYNVVIKDHQRFVVSREASSIEKLE